MLLPRELDMIVAGRHMPLPVPKPKTPEIEVKNHSGKGKSDSTKSGGDRRAAAKSGRQAAPAGRGYPTWY
jgi:hypothetical protein